MILNKERKFSPIHGPWDLRTQYPVIVPSLNDDGVINGRFDIDKMSTVKKILALTSQGLLKSYNSK